MSHARLLTGARGEALAAAYLATLGHTILQQNFRCRAGEIDLITRDGDTLVFTEVRSRQAPSRVHPVESIRAEKQRRVRQVVRAYLMITGHPRITPVRIDALTVIFESNGARIEHFPNSI